MDLATLRRDPLTALTLIALVPRLLAAVFSAGYFAHDDHFLVIEPARSWVDAADYNTWLPWNQGPDATPSGHSFVYVGLHYLLFRGLSALGAERPRGEHGAGAPAARPLEPGGGARRVPHRPPPRRRTGGLELPACCSRCSTSCPS